MEDELYHHGVKGQKWGVRRTKEQLGYKTSPKKKKSASDESAVKTAAKKTGQALSAAGKKIGEVNAKRKEAKQQKAEAEANKQRSKELSKKSYRQLSDQELRDRINRMQLEKQYRDLVIANNPKSQKGKDMVGRIIERSGEDLLTQVAKHYGAKGLNYLIGEEAVYANNKKK